MRRAADLYPGEAKTDRRDAYVLADTARTRRKQVHWLDASSMSCSASCGSSTGSTSTWPRTPPGWRTGCAMR